FYIENEEYSTLEIVPRNNRLYMKTGAEVLTLNGDTLTTGTRKIIPARNFNSFISIVEVDTLNYVKVDKDDHKETNLNLLTGTFYSEEADAKLEIKMANNRLYAYRNAAPPILLKHI